MLPKIVGFIFAGILFIFLIIVARKWIRLRRRIAEKRAKLAAEEASDVMIRAKEERHRPPPEPIVEKRVCAECGSTLDGSPVICPFCGKRQSKPRAKKPSDQ
jgi:rubrerythrin